MKQTSQPPSIKRDSAPQREQVENWLGDFGQIDLLTELPNRSQFLDRLNGAMARATRNKQFVGLMLLNPLSPLAFQDSDRPTTRH